MFKLGRKFARNLPGKSSARGGRRNELYLLIF